MTLIDHSIRDGDTPQTVSWNSSVSSLAESGDADAQYHLGVMYEEGRGVGADTRRAITWYRRAAAQGHGDAQLALGVVFALGESIEHNYTEAFEWFTEAASRGSEAAEELRALVAQKLKIEVHELLRAGVARRHAAALH